MAVMHLTTYETSTATVRIHEGTRTEAERKKAIEEAAKRFMIAVEKSKVNKG